MNAFLPGSPLAVHQRVGRPQTDIYCVDWEGALCVCSVVGAGEWSQPLPISSRIYGPDYHVTASEQFGTAKPQTDLFIIDGLGRINVFWSTGPNTSWKDTIICPNIEFLAGSPLTVTAQFDDQTHAANATIVVGVDRTGALATCSVVQDGAWSPGNRISPAGLFEPGAAVATGLRYLSDTFDDTLNPQVNVFIVDKMGALNVFWLASHGEWQFAKISGDLQFPAGADIAVSRQYGAGAAGAAWPFLSNQLDAFIVDNDGSLNVFYAFGDSDWTSEKISAPGFAAPGTAVTASQQTIIGVEQTDVFLFSGDALHVFYVVGGGAWQHEALFSSTFSAGDVPDGGYLAASQQFGAPGPPSPYQQTDVVYVNRYNQLVVCYVVDKGTWNRFVLPGQAPDPPVGHSSANNYLIGNGCSELQNVRVVLEASEDIIATSASGGFGLQVNCYSALGNQSVWQQYCIRTNPSEPEILEWVIMLFSSATTALMMQYEPLCNFATGLNLPAGYALLIELNQLETESLQPGLPVLGASFVVFNSYGDELGRKTISIMDLTLLSGIRPTVSMLTPIVGFQADVVAWGNGETTTFLSGAGTIRYSAAQGTWLGTLDESAPCLSSENLIPTAELSNMSYAYLGDAPMPSISQSFQAISPIAFSDEP